jgi:hypothetical protein
MAEELIGTITHYFPKPQVGVLKLQADLKLGDVLHIRGHTTDFEQEIESMQVEHSAVETANEGTEVAVRLRERARAGDEAYRVNPD